MDLLPNPEDGVLRALERTRSVVLEEARSLRDACARELTTREAEYSAIVREREHAYELQRRQMDRMSAFSSEQLHWTGRYIATQRDREQAAHRACEEALAALDEAQQLVARRLEEVRVVERLRARRMEEFLRARNRRRQWRLDELGVIKGWSADSVTTGEDTCRSPE